MDKIQELVEEFTTDKKIGRDIPGRLRKLGEEYGELAEAIAKFERIDAELNSAPTRELTVKYFAARHEMLMEASDMMIILMDFFNIFEVLASAYCKEKLKEINQRNYINGIKREVS